MVHPTSAQQIKVFKGNNQHMEDLSVDPSQGLLFSVGCVSVTLGLRTVTSSVGRILLSLNVVCV